MRPDGRPSGPRRPEQARVFFALWPDDNVRARLQRAAIDGARRFGGRAMQPETLHLTLAFIGDVDLDRLPALHAAAAEVSAGAFRLDLDRLGFWAHNRILWAGSSRPEPELSRLAGRLGESLLAAGWATDAAGGRPFAPHITLVRKLACKRPELPEFEAVAWDCQEFALVRSRLSSRGAAYETIGRWRLGQAVA